MRTRLLALLLVATTAVVVVPAVVVPRAVAGAATRTGGGGCGKAVTPGVTTERLTVDGVPRDYMLSIPDSYDPSTKTPLILNFHALGSSKEEQALYTGMNAKAGAKGYVVITPDGTGADLRHWIFPPLPGSAPDVAFVKALLATTARTLCIDPKRVYATGMSNGAVFATALACALPGRFAAVAPVAGVNATKVCGRGTPPTSVLAFHGTADPIVPYAGGRYGAGVNPLDDTPARAGSARAQPVDVAVARWAAFDGCGNAATTTPVAAGVEHVVYPDCPTGGTVELYRVVDGGHTWPGAFPINFLRLGATTSAIDATTLMLAFFDAHPRRG